MSRTPPRALTVTTGTSATRSSEPAGEPADVVAGAIAEVLLRGAARSSGKQPCAVFDSIAAPEMSLVDYARRIVKYFQCSHESSILSLAYIDRFLKDRPDFTLCVLNVHRLLLTSMVVAAKFFDDTYLYNSFYAQVGGVSLQELNKLELKFLTALRWELYVDRENYDRFNAVVLAQTRSKDESIEKVSRATSLQRCSRIVLHRKNCRRSLSPLGRRGRLRTVRSAA